MTFIDRAYSQGGANVQCLYLAKGNGPSARDVAKWLDDLAKATGFAGLVNSITSVVVIEATLANAPPLIRAEGKEGYFDPGPRVLWLAAHAASPQLLAHEIGHAVSVQLGPAASAELLAELFKVTFLPGQRSAAETFRDFARKAGYR
jgi:hypothetical protein